MGVCHDLESKGYRFLYIYIYREKPYRGIMVGGKSLVCCWNFVPPVQIQNKSDVWILGEGRPLEWKPGLLPRKRFLMDLNLKAHLAPATSPNYLARLEAVNERSHFPREPTKLVPRQILREA